MTLKSGVDISRIHPGIIKANAIIDKLWAAFFPEDLDGATITSGHEVARNAEGKLYHKDISRHYISNCKSGFGEAEDYRLHDVEQRKATIFGGIVWTVLSVLIPDIEFSIFLEEMLTENSHMHIQIK